jgi:hypothetical protein
MSDILWNKYDGCESPSVFLSPPHACNYLKGLGSFRCVYPPGPFDDGNEVGTTQHRSYRPNVDMPVGFTMANNRNLNTSFESVANHTDHTVVKGNERIDEHRHILNISRVLRDYCRIPTRHGLTASASAHASG